MDNFPSDVDQLKSMAEANLMPDTFVILADSSDESSVLMKRWYAENRQSIDERIDARLAREEAVRLEELKKFVYVYCDYYKGKKRLQNMILSVSNC